MDCPFQVRACCEAHCCLCFNVASMRRAIMIEQKLKLEPLDNRLRVRSPYLCCQACCNQFAYSVWIVIVMFAIGAKTTSKRLLSLSTHPITPLDASPTPVIAYAPHAF
eukprot:TRINITY_DN10466_c0_g1_i12.p2 TRINITY_DN10466_c0_g1~~TRINITY_DN10466_c0_g1_i12.p2  ORF type:complete len:108 (+),score=8.37 TRINITY_DN10466_c0_g1_i12:451-774(+)